MIEIELEKREKNVASPLNDLLVQFQKAISIQDIEEASALQESIFKRLKTKEDALILQKLHIPKQEKFARLICKNAAYKYLLDETFALIAYNELSEMEQLFPKLPEIQYNLAVLKIVLWRYNAENIEGGA